MRRLFGFTDPEAYWGGYLSIGNFDGVHRGHQRMLGALVESARREGVRAVVLTFDPHPIALLAPGKVPPSLSTLDRKAELLEKCGVDVLIAYPTDDGLLTLTPQRFFEQIVRDELRARGLVEGPNFCFGKDRAGNVATLRTMCEKAGLSLHVTAAVMDGERIVSSSAIRAAIREGRMTDAVSMLGHPYRLTGIVASGAGRGRQLGFPTANLDNVETLLPADGVYAGLVAADDGCSPAAVHVGPNPTFGEQERKLEIHLLDFDGDLYNRPLSVDLLGRVRGTMEFENADALRGQLVRDIARVREMTAPG